MDNRNFPGKYELQADPFTETQEGTEPGLKEFQVDGGLINGAFGIQVFQFQLQQFILCNGPQLITSLSNLV